MDPKFKYFNSSRKAGLARNDKSQCSQTSVMKLGIAKYEFRFKIQYPMRENIME